MSSRDQVRQDFPAVVAMADMIRASQPDPSTVRLIYAAEGGKSIGRIHDDGLVELTWHGTYTPTRRK